MVRGEDDSEIESTPEVADVVEDEREGRQANTLF